ncbi:MAG: YceD family protein [Gammaproteobacteria bacterium]
MLRTRIEAAELGELAAAGERLEIRLGVEDLPRLAGLIAGNQEDDKILAVTAGFDAGPEGYPRMRLTVDGHLHLRCQRCLSAVPCSVALTTRLTVVDNDEQAELLADPFDSVVMEAGVLDLATVTEDETLAALPMAPVHESEQECVDLGAELTDFENTTEQTYRPFESLATMVAGDDRAGDDGSSGRREK